MSDSAGCIIVTIGLPDPKAYSSETAARTPPYIYAGYSPGCYQRESGHQQSPSFNFPVFIQTFATGARVIVGAHDILAKHRTELY